ncbi:MAG: 3'-5' exonuclease [Chitinophagales bacterium]|nr:3'-5' exonuclease [Chitinophagales bacterium]
MLEKVDIANVLFLDIETVSNKSDYDQLDDALKGLWAIKGRQILRTSEEQEEETLAELYTEKAGIFAEFGKIVCISVGIVHRDKDDQLLKVRLKSFASENEAELLHDFSHLLLKYYNNTSKNYLCGHNIKEFDIPYICRRMLINQLPFPKALDIAGKKPWETAHLLDTMEFWKFGDRKNYTSLKLLAAVLGFPSPKDDIDGSEVGRVYWEEKDLDRISHYCEKDVLATVQLFLRYRRMPILEDEQVQHVGR